MNFPKYPKYANSSNGFSKDYMYKFELTGMPFDFYCPKNYKDYEGVYDPVDFYVIRDYDLLVKELKELYTVPALPEFYWKDEYISKGIINFDREQMFRYISKKYPDIITDPKNGENNRYIELCAEYIADKMYNFIHNDNIEGGILAYRMRYIFHPDKVAIFSYDIRALMWLFFKQLMNYAVAYSFVPFYCTDLGVPTFDVIISNGTRNSFRKVKTLYNYMVYMPRTINSNINSVVFGFDPFTDHKLNLR